MDLDDDPGADEFAHLVRRLSRRDTAAAAPPPAGPGALLGAARSLLGRAAAVLRFDSASPAGRDTGTRSRGGAVRHLLFSAKGRDIDLRVSPSGARFALSGQVLGPDEAGRVALAPHVRGEGTGPRLVAAELDDLGGFHVDALRPGTYVVTLTLGDDEVALPPIDVGPATP